MLIHRIERGQNIDHHYYINQCLRPLIDEIKRQRPSYGTRGIKIHYDNGKSHVHNRTSDYLESEGLTIIPHPSNSPDLSPCDFWLFDLIKENLADQSDAQSLHDAVIDFMNSITQDEYKKTFEKWIERMQLCVHNDGHYFELGMCGVSVNTESTDDIRALTYTQEIHSDNRIRWSSYRNPIGFCRIFIKPTKSHRNPGPGTISDSYCCIRSDPILGFHRGPTWPLTHIQ